MGASANVPASGADGNATSGTRGSSDRRTNGVYYTPLEVARIVVQWAIDRKTQRVIDPAFGDGVFLEAARDRLTSLGVADAESRIFGVELDPKGRSRVSRRGVKAPKKQLMQGDLFDLSWSKLSTARFDAIVGNPPYIRHHRLDNGTQQSATLRAYTNGIELDRRSDAWAYFCAHLLSFLGDRGRLALLLPGSVLHADYAQPLFDFLAGERQRVRLVRVQSRLFRDAQERTVVLLLDRADRRGGLEYEEVPGIDGLRSALRRRRWIPTKGRSRRSTGHENGGSNQEARFKQHVDLLLDKREARCWADALARPQITRLGDAATVRIGVVTGANAFFIRANEEADGLGARSVPIVSRSGWLTRERWTKSDQAAVADQPSRLLLLDGLASRRRRIRSEIEDGESHGLHERSHCRRRTPWFSLTDTASPDVFLPYMGASPPRLVLNEAGSTCTNAVHRVWLNGELSGAALAAAAWTSLYRLSAELSGRSYGGGVLKLEPGGAANLVVPIASDPEAALSGIGRAAQADGPQAAADLADELFLKESLGLTNKEVRRIRRAAERLQQRRAS